MGHPFALSKAEFLSRLQHLVNVFDIVCLNAPLTAFNHSSFNEANEYNSRILHDIETGLKHWSTLSRSIDSTCWTYAKLLVDSKSADLDHSDFENSPKKMFFIEFFS